MSGVGVKATTVLLTALIVQAAVLPQLRIAGASADVMLVVAVAAGFTGGPERGVIVGFFAGLLLDLVVVGTPVGLTALAYCLVGYAVGALRGVAIREYWWFPPTMGILAGAGGVAVFVGLAELVNVPLVEQPQLPAVVVVVSLATGLFMGPATRIVAWAWFVPVRPGS